MSCSSGGCRGPRQAVGAAARRAVSEAAQEPPETQLRLAPAPIAVLLLQFILGVFQFRSDSIGPLSLATLVFAAVWKLRPELRRASAAILTSTLALLLVDIHGLHHRIGVAFRTWTPGWDDREIVDVLPSPSGHSTAYVVIGGFVDTSYFVHISDGSFAPGQWTIDARTTDAAYPKDFAGSWDGPILSIGDFRYDERTREGSTILP